MDHDPNRSGVPATGAGLTPAAKLIAAGSRTEVVQAGRAVATRALAPEYLGQLITTGSFGRDLTPKELFSLPYSNPNWPLIATIDDMRQALYKMVTSHDWMLTDSDGTEIRPAEAGQIQTASMQQVLRPRQPSTNASSGSSTNGTGIEGGSANDVGDGSPGASRATGVPCRRSRNSALAKIL